MHYPQLDALRAHRSIRRFTQEPVTDEELQAILTTAQRSSTSSNVQAYSVIVVHDQDTKAKLAELCGNQRQVADCPVFLAFCADLNRARVVCEAAGYEFKPRFIEYLLVAAIDATIFGQTTLAAAEAIGLGGCMIGAARNHPFELAEILGLPPLVFVVFGMTLGHPDLSRTPPQRPRLPWDALVHYERYDAIRWPAAHTTYDRAMHDTGAYEGRHIDLSRRVAGWTEKTPSAAYGWIEHSARRWIDPAGARIDVRPFLDRQGFGLE
jgi:nitroreductase